MANVGEQAARAADVWARAQKTWSGLSEVLARLVPLARGLVRVVHTLAWAGIIAAALIVAGIVLADVPQAWWTVVLLLVFGAALCIPSAILFLFHGALVEVLALPEWLRRSPDLAREHGVELGRLVAASTGPGERRRFGVARDVGKAGKLLLKTHQDLPGYGDMLRLINVPFLLASVASVVVIVAFWIAVPFVLIAGALIRAFS